MGSLRGRLRVGGLALSYGLYQGSGRPAQAEKSGYRRRLVLFMCDFTCSRCWRSLLAIGRLRRAIEESMTRVEVIGDARNLRHAQALADELGLPFAFTSDESGALRRLGRPLPRSRADHASTAVLVDEDGKVRHRRHIQNPEELVDDDLMAVLALPPEC